MRTHEIQIDGIATGDSGISGFVIHELLGALFVGCEGTVRIRLEGRSQAPGPKPAWLSSSDFAVDLDAPRAVVRLQSRSLAEADPDSFSQRDMFQDIDPDLACLDYLERSLEALALDRVDGLLYDRPLLAAFKRINRVFKRGATALTFCNGRSFRLMPETLAGLRALEGALPEARRVRVAGTLDELRASKSSFGLLLPEGSELVKGTADKLEPSVLKELWGGNVVVEGTAHYAANGRVLRIDADHVRKANDRELALWGRVPAPLFGGTAKPSRAHASQGPRSGLNNLFGRWPGDESDDEVYEALEAIS